MFEILSFSLFLIDTFIVLKIIRDSYIHLLLKIFLGISFFGWNVAPYLLSLLPTYQTTIEVSFDFYLLCCSINFFFLFITYLTAIFFSKKKSMFDNLFVKQDYQYNHRFLKMLTNVSIIVMFVVILMGLGNTDSYTENNSVEKYDENVFLGTVSFFRGVAVYVLISILFFYQKIVPKNQISIIFVLLVVNFVIIVFSGSRIHLFAIIILVLYLGLQQKNKRIVAIVIGLSIFSLSILPAISVLRKTGDSYNASDIMKARNKDSGDIVWEVLNKTNSVHSSSYLILYSGIGSGGMQVYTSTLFALLPRFIYPSKPQPGSMDGTMAGLPGRLAANIDNAQYSEVANVGISTSLEALWAGGIVVFFIQALFCGYIIALMNKAIKGRKILFLYFIFTLTSFPVCMLDISIVNFSVSVQRFMLLYLVFYVLFSNKFHVNRRRMKSQLIA